VGVEGFHRLDDTVIRGIEHLLLRINRALIIPPHHFGIEIRAIVELHPLAQVKHVDLAILQDPPRFRQVRHIIQFGIDREQAVEQIAHHMPGLPTTGQD
jgi:hypothetical protein